MGFIRNDKKILRKEINQRNGRLPADYEWWGR